MAKKKVKKNPRKKHPMDEGAEAALCGVSDTKNPYPSKNRKGEPNPDHLSWNDGYNSINYEEESGE